MTAGWLTFFEVMEETGLPYPEVKDLAERRLLGSRSSGAAVLYDPDDVALIRSAHQRPAGS